MLAESRQGETAFTQLARGRVNPVPMARIVIVSHVRLVREALVVALSRRDGIEVIDAVEPTSGVEMRIAAARPDAVLLDMGSQPSLAFARRLVAALPSQAKLIAFAVSEVERNIEAFAEAGICGFVSRDGSVDELVGAIESAMRGELQCSPRIAASMLRRLAVLSGQRGSATPALLTRREAEIVALVDEGLSNKEIGLRLRIGTATVKNHVHHLLAKLKVQRRGQAAARARYYSA